MCYIEKERRIKFLPYLEELESVLNDQTLSATLKAESLSYFMYLILQRYVGLNNTYTKSITIDSHHLVKKDQLEQIAKSISSILSDDHLSSSEEVSFILFSSLFKHTNNPSMQFGLHLYYSGILEILSLAVEQNASVSPKERLMLKRRYVSARGIIYQLQTENFRRYDSDKSNSMITKNGFIE